MILYDLESDGVDNLKTYVIGGKSVREIFVSVSFNSSADISFPCRSKSSYFKLCISELSIFKTIELPVGLGYKVAENVDGNSSMSEVRISNGC